MTDKLLAVYIPTELMNDIDFHKIYTGASRKETTMKALKEYLCKIQEGTQHGN